MKVPVGLVVALCVLCGTVDGNSYVYSFDELLWHMIDRGFQSKFSGDFVDQVLNIYAPTSRAVESHRCRNDSATYRSAIKRNQGWALRMLDASSKVPSGLLEGNVLNLGNYDECLKVEAGRDSSYGGFMGQHCMVNMGVDTGAETTNITTFRPNANGLLGEFTFLLGAKWSVCIPSSCSPRDLQAHLRSVLKDMMGDINVTVGHDACRSRAHPSVLTPADWFAISLFLFFGVLVLLSTAYDFIHRKSASRSTLLASFSVYTNGCKLLTLSPVSDNLQALHGLRTLSMMWVVIGHTYDQMLDSPAINSSVAEMIRGDWRHAALMNYRLAVDTFLLLSGLLLCYVFLKGVTRGAPFNLVRFYLHRYIRLTPAYAAMILLTATLIGSTGDGPLWQDVVIADQEKCKSNWWTGLLYINNYVNPLEACMDQSWYLSVDMQLYLLSPLLLYPLWRWKVYGKVLLAGLVFTGVLTGFLIGWINEFAINDQADINVSEYLPTHARFTTWVMGVGLGYLLHTSKDSRTHLSPLVVAGGWILSVSFLLSAIVANHILDDGDLEYSRWAESLNSGLNKPAWALGVAWIVFACSKGYGGFVNSFLSSRIFQLLSRLTYCVYLVHYAFILWLTGSIKTPVDLNDRTILMVFLSITVLAFAAALVLSLVFEVPALVIEKILLGKDTPKERNQSKYVVEERNTKDNRQGEELVEIIGTEATFTKEEEG